MTRLVGLILLTLTGCDLAATPGPQSPAANSPPRPGANVVVAFLAPRPDCQNRGLVYGQSVFQFGLQPSTVHVTRAVDAARDEAARLGANYVQLAAPQIVMGQAAPYGAAISGIAYACPAVPPSKEEPHPIAAKEVRVDNVAPTGNCRTIHTVLLSLADAGDVRGIEQLREQAGADGANYAEITRREHPTPTSVLLRANLFYCP